MTFQCRSEPPRGTLPRKAWCILDTPSSKTRLWKGLSPLAFAPNTGDLAGRVDLSLSREFRTPTGCVIFGSAEANPLTEEQAAKLGERLSQGHLVSIGQSPRDVSPATGYAGDAGWLPPNSNPVAGRIGPEPPASVSELRSGVSADILAAFGVPPTIYAPNAASAREGWREFLHGTIAPIGKLVAEELEAKLGAQGVRVRLPRNCRRPMLAGAAGRSAVWWTRAWTSAKRGRWPASSGGAA